MTLSLKDAYQIKIAPSYTAADGKRFLDLAEAQTHTRDRMLESAIVLATKQNPEFARLDKPLLKEFLLLSGAVVGQIMAEKLEPLAPPQVHVTNTPRAGESEEQSAARDRIGTGYKVSGEEEPAARLRRLTEGAKTELHRGESVMPKTQNPDIFQNRNPVLQATDAVDDQLTRELDEQVSAAMKLAGHG